MFLADHLIEATPENILKCMHWVNDDLSARGTTDINAPLQRALKLLSGAPGLPFVFLLTDGESLDVLTRRMQSDVSCILTVFLVKEKSLSLVYQLWTADCL